MAGPPAGRRNAGKPESHRDETDDVKSASARVGDESDEEAGGDTGRTATTDAFWADAQIDPLEIALPAGVGYTLRAYRLDSQVTPSDTSTREDDVELPSRRSAYADELDDVGDTFEADESPDFDTGDEADFDPESDDDDVAGADEAPERPDEEVPLFLSHAGHLLLFRTPESLVAFVQSDAEHDLAQLDNWSSFAASLRPAYVVPLPEDAYELDLVVSNLRGGPDAWDPPLIVQSGQLARDLGHALRIEPIVIALSPGSPLDDLDEALRGVAVGGLGAFFARRKAKKIGTETASLGWRTVIGKISAVVDWRD